MKYFLHDTNAFQDEKITELYIQFGYEGIGLYFTILEKLALQEKPIKTVVLKKQLNVKKRLNKCWNFIEEIDLISSNNGETFSKTLLNFSEKYQIKKEKNRKRISEWRKNQRDTKNVTCYKSVRNNDKVNKSKVNRNKDNNKEYGDEIKNFTQSLYKYFPDKIINNLTPTQKQNWYKTIDELIRIDNYTIQQITTIVANVREDDFWQKNFLSITKLRKTKDGVKYITRFEQIFSTITQDLSENGKYKYNKFYDEELKKTNNDEKYKQFIEILFGKNNLGIKLNSVLSMKIQVDYNQFRRIYTHKRKLNISIANVLEQMENWKKLNTRTIVSETFIDFAKNMKK